MTVQQGGVFGMTDSRPVVFSIKLEISCNLQIIYFFLQKSDMIIATIFRRREDCHVICDFYRRLFQFAGQTAQ